MKKKNGFTILEILIVGVFAALFVILFIVQKSSIDAMNRDEKRKTAINAMYYALEDGFYAQNKYYPETISEQNIKYIDPALWTDPSGYNVNDPLSTYFYEPADCEEGRCKEYTLRAELEKESVYIKRNRN
jgi:type II secretory pathway pseudopilin PulG